MIAAQRDEARADRWLIVYGQAERFRGVERGLAIPEERQAGWWQFELVKDRRVARWATCGADVRNTRCGSECDENNESKSCDRCRTCNHGLASY